MSRPKKCVRCGFTEAEHPTAMSPAEALALPDGGPCHRFEAKAPLGLRFVNRI